MLRPRLTSALRASEGQEPPDVDRLFVDRAAARAARAPAPPAALSWKSFVAGNLPAATKALRNLFDELLELLRSAAPEAPVGESALFAYAFLGTRWAVGAETVAATADDRAHVEAAVGSLGDPAWHRLLLLVAQLRAWQVEQGVPLPAESAGPQHREWGADVHTDTAMPPLVAVDDWMPVALAAELFEEDRRPAAAPDAGGVPNRVDAGWLLQMCEQHHSSFEPRELAARVVETIARTSDDDALQTELFDLLGDAFEFVSACFQHRGTLARLTRADLTRRQPAARRPAPAPTVQQGFNVATAAEIREDKQRRREARRHGRQAASGAAGPADPLEAAGFDPAMLAQERLLGLGGGAARLGPAEPEPIVLSDVLELRGSGKSLPQGTTRHWHDDNAYEEVSIPARHAPPASQATRVPIASLPDFARLAFRGMESLNRLQSEIFDTAFNTGENLLVCAPTGAGKTNVAMLTVLQQVRAHMDQGVLLKDKFKIIYVAPMKALAQEVVGKFSKRLNPLGMTVAELTGDMQMTKREIEDTQVIVTTPEKWDVVTRKSGDGTLVQQVRLLIIDEVHLLADDRGSVIESIVARTLRLVETSQSMVRIVGLSATLPNYQDVARFLRVDRGLFFFDDSYRPVALRQTFIGINSKSRGRQMQMQIQLAYEKARGALLRDKQVMIFVHSRKDTVNTCKQVWALAARAADGQTFTERDSSAVARYANQVAKSRNADLRELYEYGMGIHHAGMLRSDRNLSEKMFMDGAIKVLCCTATLAWGVNLPAHTVIIKGTEIYNPEKGGMMPLSMLDVMQIFGRAGRPQFDTEGDAIMLTNHEQLPHYLGFLCNAMPIESSFIKSLPDHLNAEVVSGTVTNVREAVTWLSYTYLHVRMQRNPLVYGITPEDLEGDPGLAEHRTRLIEDAARTLDECRMLRFDARSGNLGCTDMGRVASHYYIRHQTVEEFQEQLEPHMTDAQVFAVISSATEFENVKVRDEELKEMDDLIKNAAMLDIGGGGVENSAGKVNLLLQAYLSHCRPRSFTLISDTNYVVQNAGRIARALFETALKKSWSSLAERMLTVCKAIDRQMWWFQTPLRQFPHANGELMHKVEAADLSLDRLRDEEAGDIGRLVRNVRAGDKLRAMAWQVPKLELEASVQTITRGIVRVALTLEASFQWHDRMSGKVEPFWVWIEDGENEHIYAHEYFLLYKHQRRETHELEFTIPIFEPIPAQYHVRAVSDRWLGAETVHAVSFQHLILPDRHPPHTPLLDLTPLPVTALQNPAYEALYPFSHFNPLQTQIFHCAYHTNRNMLLGSPTGSGKTIAAELALLRLWNVTPGAKTVYVAPLKALARERIKDWRRKFQPLGKTIVELTGDAAPDMRQLRAADVLITTPEKWDGVTRNWRQRSYVKAVQLVIIDEIHLLGEDRGPVLEVIVSRMRYIAEHTKFPVRLVGLSTALANAQDLADWLGIKKNRPGLYNFSPAVRPIPMEVHIQGFPGKHYCPRMATMNKPCYAAIMEHSPDKPVLIFVASRRQTRLTALDLISYCAAGENPRQFVRGVDEADLDQLLLGIKDSALRHTLAFGIGIHHAGLSDHDRSVVEELFVNGRIQVLCCTSTLAWGVNFPAHLVIVKGTEFFDGKAGRYVDFPITDVLQMIGRAGRPQFDTHGVACILVHEPKKNFYRKFLYEPFPVESQLRSVLHNHLNAEIAGGSVRSRADAADWLSWTYFFRRLVQNPTYYHLEGTSAEQVHDYLLSLVDTTLRDLEAAGCVSRCDDDFLVAPDTLGLVTSYYYLDYSTGRIMREGLRPDADMEAVLRLLANAAEYRELPVRHNEDRLNAQLAAALPWGVPDYMLDSPHAKCFLLLQARMLRVPLPIADYNNDTKSVVDQALRILNAMVDIAGDAGHLSTALNVMRTAQLVVQARFPGESSLLQLPHLRAEHVEALPWASVGDLVRDERDPKGALRSRLHAALSRAQLNDVCGALDKFPVPRLLATAALVPDGEDGDAVLHATIRHSRRPGPVYCPKFHKPKRHGWWLVLGCEDTDELIALKRISPGERSARLSFAVDDPADRLRLWLVSDCAAGTDVSVEVGVPSA